MLLGLAETDCSAALRSFLVIITFLLSLSPTNYHGRVLPGGDSSPDIQERWISDSKLRGCLRMLAGFQSASAVGPPRISIPPGGCNACYGSSGPF